MNGTQSGGSLDELFPLVVDGVHILPVLHERLEYADCVRQAVQRLKPDAVVVETPSTLEELWVRAVDRLPAVSVLLYENSDGQTIYLPIQPADPMTEAARTARERGLGFCCGDLDVDGYADYRDPVPDPYALLRLGPARLYSSFLAHERRRDPLDDRREASMAYHARRLLDQGCRRLLLVCGMHHAKGIAAQLGREQATPLTRPRRLNARLVHLDPESLGEVLSDIPFHIAVYEARRHGPPPEPERQPSTAPRTRGPFRVLSGGRPDDARLTAAAIARAAREAGAEGSEGPECLDRLRSQWVLLAEAERVLTAVAPDERVHGWQRINLARFGRNLALASGQLVPDLYDLLSAARGSVSENFAWELHRLATAYPPQERVASGMPTARIRADEMYDGVRRLKLQRQRRRVKRPDWRRLLKRRDKREAFPGEWAQSFESGAICSYPPEDIVIEDFGRYLMRRGKSILSEELARTVPFSTSVLDGIDVRETIRHWPEHKIYVREYGRSPGKVGAVVIVFDEDEERYDYLQTWLGEHDQESDMAFFSTDPADAIVGPGISRVTYGGLAMSYPPRRMADVWTDPDYRFAESKAEVLLLSALDYSTQRVVVHVASRPPRGIIRQLASRLGLKILHVPLGTLSPTTVRRIRVAHILSGHEKREIASDYIW